MHIVLFVLLLAAHSFFVAWAVQCIQNRYWFEARCLIALAIVTALGVGFTMP